MKDIYLKKVKLYVKTEGAFIIYFEKIVIFKVIQHVP